MPHARGIVFLAGFVMAQALVAAPLDIGLLEPHTSPATVTREKVNLALRTAPGATAAIGGVPAPVYSTGVFVRDQIPLALGLNRIRVTVAAADGRKAERVVELRRDPPQPARPGPAPAGVQIEDGVEPARDLALLPGDPLEVAFHGTPGQLAEFRLGAGPWQPVHEDRGAGGAASGHYRATVVMTHTSEQAAQAVEVRLLPPGAPPVTALARGRVALWSPGTVRLATVTREIGTEPVYGLHDVRLGGPAVGRMPTGTLLRVTGQKGKNWRVQLLPSLAAWVEAEHVRLAPPATPLPRLSFTTILVKGDPAGARVEIPYGAPVPFAAQATTAPSGRPAIDVDLFGAQHAATWISHRREGQLVREVTVQQPATDHVRVQVEVDAQRLWGFKVEPQGGALVVLVRAAPKFGAAPASPLAGLVVAVEAGHGGSNEGAKGLMNVPEKDITRPVAQLLTQELIRAGARVVTIRKGDEFVSMEDRAKRTLASGAQLFVSIHCNSADTTNGYLRVGGTSTFYKHPHHRELARAVQATMLADTGLPDFGSVGNFNYYPVRALSWMPAVLVETAFVSNPYEEAKLLEPAFRATIARAVRRGVEDFLRAYPR